MRTTRVAIAAVLVVACSGPPSAVGPEATTADWRSKRPPVRDWTRSPDLEIDEQRLSNGTRVVLVAIPTSPLVAIDAIALGGAATTPPSLTGIDSVVLELMLAAADAPGSLAIRTEGIGATVESAVLLAYARLRLVGLRRYRAETIELLGELLAAEVSEPAVASARERAARQLAERHSDGRRQTLDLFRHHLFGSDHPLGASPLGTPESLSRIGAADVRDRLASAWSPSNMIVVVAGRFETAAILADLERHLGGRAAPEPSSAAAETVRAASMPRPRAIILDAPGATQVRIVAGHRLDCSHTDAGVDLLNAVFGSERLNRNLRGQQGLTYGVRSSISRARRGDHLFVFGSFQIDGLPAALSVIDREMRSLASSGPGASELSRARNRALLGRAIRFDRTASAAGELDSQLARGLSSDQVRGYAERLRQTPASGVAAAAKDCLRPDDLVYALRGPRSEIELALEAAKIPYWVAEEWGAR